MKTIKKNKKQAIIVLTNAAQDGYKIQHNGKTIWGGLGNRAGLHSYAMDLLYEKWEKSGQRFVKKLEKLVAKGEVFEVFCYRNTSRNRGRWASCGKLQVV